jgi:hypothetical protein
LGAFHFLDGPVRELAGETPARATGTVALPETGGRELGREISECALSISGELLILFVGPLRM